MDRIQLPASVKVAKSSINCTNAIVYDEIPIYPGEKEVALLLATNWLLVSPVANRLEGLIWKKAHPAVKANIFTQYVQEEDVIDYEQTFIISTTAEGIWQGSIGRYKAYPQPLVLIRPPQLVTIGLVMTSGIVVVTCYYVFQRVTDEQLAKLMVKDHA
ncbi:hypothetical protein ES703_89566 [subsurface metagenome]